MNLYFAPGSRKQNLYFKLVCHTCTRGLRRFLLNHEDRIWKKSFASLLPFAFLTQSVCPAVTHLCSTLLGAYWLTKNFISFKHCFFDFLYHKFKRLLLKGWSKSGLYKGEMLDSPGWKVYQKNSVINRNTYLTQQIFGKFHCINLPQSEAKATRKLCLLWIDSSTYWVWLPLEVTSSCLFKCDY